MIIVAGIILIMLIVWGIRVGIRRARKKARARAEAKTRARALAVKACPLDEQGEGPSRAECSAG